VIIPIKLRIKLKIIPGKYDLKTNFLPVIPIITFSIALPYLEIDKYMIIKKTKEYNP
tara:strand:+ start:374 stop:544 length:171 start_codon:yes stop_codon:yes gene_type:complete